MYYKYNYSVLFFFGLIILLPFIGIFSKINFDLEVIYNFFLNSYTHRLIYFSLYQAFLSALLSCFLAIPFALALNRHKNLKIIKFIISLCGFCFVIPTILIVFAVIKLFGNNGFYNSYFNLYENLSIETIYGIKAILIAFLQAEVTWDSTNNLKVPKFIQIDPKEINKNKEKWIDEWLNSYSLELSS